MQEQEEQGELEEAVVAPPAPEPGSYHAKRRGMQVLRRRKEQAAMAAVAAAAEAEAKAAAVTAACLLARVMKVRHLVREARHARARTDSVAVKSPRVVTKEMW